MECGDLSPPWLAAIVRHFHVREEKARQVGALQRGVINSTAMRKRTTIATTIVLAILSSACSTSLFKVKPVIELPSFPENSRTADAGGVTVRVAPLLSDEETQDLFEVNLPMTGVLAVRTELNHQSGVPVEVKKARFRLQDGQGRTWKLLNPKQAVSRIMSANGITLYNPNSKKQFEKEFTAYGLDLKTPLSTADRTRQGFLFFQTPDKRPVEFSQKLTLTIERLPQTASIAIN